MVRMMRVRFYSFYEFVVTVVWFVKSVLVKVYTWQWLCDFGYIAYLCEIDDDVDDDDVDDDGNNNKKPFNVKVQSIEAPKWHPNKILRNTKIQRKNRITLYVSGVVVVISQGRLFWRESRQLEKYPNLKKKEKKRKSKRNERKI